MAEELKSEAEQNEWLCQQAAFWRDLARGFSGEAESHYHHSSWLYINLLSFLTPEDKSAMQSTVKVNQSLDPPPQEREEMNVVQTIRLARRLLADKNTPDEKKAVMLCWIYHGVGDIHQPLHSCALFSKT